MHFQRRVRAGVAAAVSTVAFAYLSPTAQGKPAPPRRLRDTGLYSDWSRRTVDVRNLPYSPQYPLWSDGASKRRWIRIPAGRHIDGTDPNAWRFPVGTRLWKEFSFGRTVETRYMERLPSGEWMFASYVWNDDGEATLAPEAGVHAVAPIAAGVSHDIPSTADCRACHEGRTTAVLGFDVLQLSPDRDPLAPNAEPIREGDIDLDQLVVRGLLRSLPDWVTKQPPRIPGRPSARAALGYLHGNCANCHNAAGPLAELGMDLSHTVTRSGDGAVLPAVRTTVAEPARFNLGGATARMVPGNPETSLLYLRMASRHPVAQMPPLGTHIVDEQGLDRLRRWIAEEAPSKTSTLHKEIIP